MAKKQSIERRYQTLDVAAIVHTLAQLSNRVAERFPSRGLSQTANFLVDLSRSTADEAARLGEPNWLLRLLAAAALAAGVFGLYQIRDFLPSFQTTSMNFAEFTQGLDATFNIIVLVGLSVTFLLSLESRFKRRQALDGLYRLRAISHVIDMHQLTKDPASILGGERTGSSPERDLSRDMLLRYLDYCTEMLSMIGKLAALYVQHFPDPVVIDTVNDIEVLTTNLSRKIWQKIVVVQGERQD